MYTQPYPEATKAKGGITTMARNVEGWLDQRGKGAWIAAMVLGFIFVWPLGLAILAYMIWSKRMFGKSCRTSYTQGRSHMGGFRPSGNGAFDAYREETIRRLMDEQEAFESFLQRLRDAKDKTEFDAFMEDRAKTPRDTKAAETKPHETSEA